MDYKEINDYELLYMICDNDDTLEILLQKYKPIVNQKVSKWRGVSRKLGVEVEDLEQEIYLTIISAINSYDDSGASFYTYLNILIERRLVNFFRNQRTCKNQILLNAISLSTSIAEDYTIEDVISDKDAVVEDIVMERELMSKLSYFCYDLPFDDAAVFELFINGYSSDVISQLLEMTKKRVSYLLCKIRKKLKKYLFQNDLLVV